MVSSRYIVNRVVLTIYIFSNKVQLPSLPRKKSVCHASLVVALTPLIRSGRHSSIALKAVIGIASVVDEIVVPALEFVISHYATIVRREEC
jgi:hypothetical protein